MSPVIIAAIGIGLIVAFLIFSALISWYAEVKHSLSDREWKIFSTHKPPSSGWYLCTVELGSRIPMLLYWDYGAGGRGRFIDPVRKSVFDTYEVMITRKKEDNKSIMPDEEYMEKLHEDGLCNLTNFVIAWKTEPKVYMGSVRTSRNTGMDRADYIIYSEEEANK